ncbi:amino acid/polyamine transporter I [Scheffersomyces xylosifermentans]|uniref:amino acid/polyamine transporter I n=1 Tax=Scheffersomyces xylosifermentans TaxID=1304137 RepID=UPI00315DBC3D
MGPNTLERVSSRTSHVASLFSKGNTKEKLGTLSCISLIVNKIIGTGIFSNPSIIFKYTNGNVGLFLSLFLVGGIVIFCGLLIYLEYALNLPFKNGGEKNYLLRVFNRPKGLMGCVYSFSIVLLGFSSGNSYSFGKYVLYAVTDHQDGDATNDTMVKIIGVACISFCILLHTRYPNQGTQLFNFLGIFKILILVLIILMGAAVSLKLVDVPPTDNFTNIWSFHNRQTPNSYSVSVALLEVIYSFKGWENVNYVLNEINDPYTVLTIAAPAAVLLTTVLYFLVLVAYLIVIPRDELLSSGVLVAGIFFNKIFGQSVTSRLLPILISFSNLGNVLVVSYAHSVVNQELAYNNYLPFSKFFQNLNHSLLLHWAITVFILVAPPSTEIYEFVVNLYIYPGTWINVLLTLGLIYLKLNRKKEMSVSSSTLGQTNNNKIVTAPFICVIIFLFANIFLALFPFVPPPNAAEMAIPYWAFPVIGSGVFVLGAAFFYARPYVRLWRGTVQDVHDVKYEEEYYPLH